MSCCKKCCTPTLYPLEYDIAVGETTITEKNNIQTELFPSTNIDLLKDKVICEYQRLITNLENGKYSDIEFILEEISVIDLENELDNRDFIIQYYLNNGKN